MDFGLMGSSYLRTSISLERLSPASRTLDLLKLKEIDSFCSEEYVQVSELKAVEYTCSKIQIMILALHRNKIFNYKWKTFSCPSSPNSSL